MVQPFKHLCACFSKIFFLGSIRHLEKCFNYIFNLHGTSASKRPSHVNEKKEACENGEMKASYGIQYDTLKIGINIQSLHQEGYLKMLEVLRKI